MEEKRITVKKETGEGKDKTETEIELVITKPTNKQMLEAEARCCAKNLVII